MVVRLLRILLFIVIIVAIYGFAQAKGWLPASFPQLPKLPWPSKNQENDLAKQNIRFRQEDLEKLGADGLEQVKILAERAKVAGNVAQEFAHQAIKKDEQSEQNISEKAFEYGRYIYCQEVVKQYEATASKTNAP